MGEIRLVFCDSCFRNENYREEEEIWVSKATRVTSVILGLIAVLSSILLVTLLNLQTISICGIVFGALLIAGVAIKCVKTTRSTHLTNKGKKNSSLPKQAKKRTNPPTTKSKIQSSGQSPPILTNQDSTASLQGKISDSEDSMGESVGTSSKGRASDSEASYQSLPAKSSTQPVVTEDSFKESKQVTGEISLRSVMLGQPLGDISDCSDKCSYYYLPYLKHPTQDDRWRSSKESIMAFVQFHDIKGKCNLPNRMWLPVTYLEGKNDGDVVTFTYKEVKYTLKIAQHRSPQNGSFAQALAALRHLAPKKLSLLGGGMISLYSLKDIQWRYQAAEGTNGLKLTVRDHQIPLASGRAVCGVGDSSLDHLFLQPNYDQSLRPILTFHTEGNKCIFIAVGLDIRSIDLIFYSDRIVFYGHVMRDPLFECELRHSKKGLCVDYLVPMWYTEKIGEPYLPKEIATRIQSMIARKEDPSQAISINYTNGIVEIT